MTDVLDRSWARYDDPAWRTAAGLPGFERTGRASQPLDPQAPPRPVDSLPPQRRKPLPPPASEHPASNAQAPTRAGSDADRAARIAAAKTKAGAGTARGDRVARESRIRKHVFAAGLAVFAGCFGLVVQAGTGSDASDGGEFDDAAAAMTLETSTPAAAVIVLPRATPPPTATPASELALGRTDDAALAEPAGTATIQSVGASARQTVIAAATARAVRVAGRSDGTVATATATAEPQVAGVVDATTPPRATPTPRPVTVPATPTPRVRTRSSR